MLRFIMSFVSCAALSVLLLTFTAPVAQAQDNPRIVSVSGKADILAAGGEVNEAKPGFRMQPGQAIRLEGGGEVRFSAENGTIEIIASNGAVMRYDGQVDERSRPWHDSAWSQASNGGATQFTVPAGKVDVQVVTGRSLRIVAPLVTASVRGTHFTMYVAKDGSSSMKTLQGRVETLGRQGEVRMAGAGQGLTVTASQYVHFLRAKGVAISPKGDWRTLDPAVLQRMDEQSFGDRFANPDKAQVAGASSDDAGNTGDGESLDAILADSGSHPMAGQAAVTGGSQAPLFQLAANTNAGQSALISGGTPAANLVQMGALSDKADINTSFRGNRVATVSGTLSPTGLFNAGAFTPSSFTSATGNFAFDVSLRSGFISNAAMSVTADASNNFSVANGRGIAGPGTFYINSFTGDLTAGASLLPVNPYGTFLGGRVSPGGFFAVGNRVDGTWNHYNQGFQVMGGTTTVGGDMSGQVTNIQP